MRVLHLNSSLKGGGTDDRSVRIAHALMREGHDIWMAGPLGREFSKIAEGLGIPFLSIPLGPLRIPLILSTARILRQHRIEILHARHGRDYWPAILAARLSGCRPRVVLSRHLAKSPGSMFSRQFLLSQCNALVAVSRFTAKVLREGHSDRESDNPERHYRAPMKGDFRKIHVVYGGFDMERFRPAQAEAQRQAWGLNPANYVFAVIGGYAFPRGKGQPEFLRAAALMHQQAPQARFLVIGRGNMKDMLENEIRRLGLEGVAWLTPYSHDMPAAMNAIDCLVLPQVGTEAIPGVVIEAHACGKPVIASDLDGIPEAFEVAGYGRLVERGSVPALTEAMRHWVTQKPLEMAGRLEMHQKVADQFSLDRAAAELSKFYRSLGTLPQARD